MIFSDAVRKAFKYISCVSMWFAIAAIWAHMIIPHDHHILETFSDQEKNCPASNHQSDHKSEIPVHCHAFNDFASEKARVFHFVQDVRDGYMAVISFPDFKLSEPLHINSGLFDFQPPLTSSFFHELHLLRAPPSLA